ncbi:cell division protein FtsQ/DivIB [Pontibaca salina]|uniref:Cell division protein FtsQ n=1 Tax=Pontibaca salina TaxID=2795731 RepID=A0A934HMW9_9RHOB|nr:cell division protein FtsQ/DivIB [Pontibaca salina]MBI6629881.1 cell division protein FtsQ/DivIB [Pontibaca salina]
MRPLTNRPNRIDPAPSRMAYRLQRWMLTPGIRAGLRIGLPLGLLIIGVGTFLADPARRANLVQTYADIRASIEARPEFMVNLMAVDGASEQLVNDIRNVAAISFPISSFDLDIEQIRSRVVALDPVKQANLRIRPGGILQVDVIERQPVVVWRTNEGLSLLDDSGVLIGTVAERAARSDLPLIAGVGADDQVAEALALVAAAQPLKGRLRGLVRIGQRRWDMVLDRDQRIMLPSEKPVRALERVIALDHAQDMLERDVTAVDMRLTARPTLRMTQAAVEHWWQIRKIN